MMAIISLLLSALVIMQGIKPQKISKLWKIILSAITLLAAFKFYIQRIFGGAMFAAPEIPPWILLVTTWLFALLMFYALFLLVYGIVRKCVIFICRRKNKTPGRFFTEPLWRAAGIIPAAILVTLGMYGGLKNPEVRHYELSFPDLPDKFDGMKIVHLSDIHADPFTGESKLQYIVEVSNSLAPDMIVITGDFVDGRSAVREKALRHLAGLQAPYGVYGVPGNHEYYSGYARWMEFLADNNVVMLENRHVMLTEDFALGGVTDPAAAKRGGELPDIGAAFENVPENSFRLLLAHQPKLAAGAAEKKVDLQLSGHTHGGMIYGMDLLVGCFNHGLVSGIYKVGEMKLVISNGTGIWNGFPLRLGRPSEIVVLTLRKSVK